MKRVMKVKLAPGARMPERAHPSDSGLDLFSLESFCLQPGEALKVDTGVSLEIPVGFEGQVRPKSGLASVGIYALFGTIDQNYRGSIRVIMHNLSSSRYCGSRGDKIGQLVIAPVLIPTLQQVEELSSSDRGENGFGSTGK